MKKHLIRTLILPFLLAGCSASEEKSSPSEPLALPTKLIFASPKISPVTPEMKAIYKEWVTLLKTSQDSQNCQIIKEAPVQKTDPVFSGDVVKIISKNDLSGFYCPVRGSNLWTYKAVVVTHDRSRQILNLNNELTATSELTVVDPKTQEKTNLLSMKAVYTMTGSTVYRGGSKTNEYNKTSYVTILENNAKEIITMTASGEIAEAQGVLSLQIIGNLTKADTSIEVTVLQKEGALKTFLNGNAINPDDNLPAFPLPEWSSPHLENTNL